MGVLVLLVMAVQRDPPGLALIARDLALGVSGILFIADSGNNRVRKLVPSGAQPATITNLFSFYLELSLRAKVSHCLAPTSVRQRLLLARLGHQV